METVVRAPPITVLSLYKQQVEGLSPQFVRNITSGTSTILSAKISVVDIWQHPDLVFQLNENF